MFWHHRVNFIGTAIAIISKVTYDIIYRTYPEMTFQRHTGAATLIFFQHFIVFIRSITIRKIITGQDIDRSRQNFTDSSSNSESGQNCRLLQTPKRSTLTWEVYQVLLDTQSCWHTWEWDGRCCGDACRLGALHPAPSSPSSGLLSSSRIPCAVQVAANMGHAMQ